MYRTGRGVYCFYVQPLNEYGHYENKLDDLFAGRDRVSELLAG